MLVLRFGRFPCKTSLCIFKRKKRNPTPQLSPVSSLLLSPQHLVSAYLNSLRVRVYFCEIVINQYNCIWHFFTHLLLLNSHCSPQIVRGKWFHKNRTFSVLWLPLLWVWNGDKPFPGCCLSCRSAQATSSPLPVWGVLGREWEWGLCWPRAHLPLRSLVRGCPG